MTGITNPAQKQFIVKALRSGFNESQIADNLGISQSAVHQYIEAHELGQELAQGVQMRKVDDNLNEIELTLTEKLKVAINHTPMNPMQLGALLKIVNSTRRRTVETPESAQGVLVYLPAATTAPFVATKNSRNELVELNGRSFVTMPSGQLYDHATGGLLDGI